MQTSTQDTRRVSLTVADRTIAIDLPTPIRLGDPVWERKAMEAIVGAIDTHYEPKEAQ